MKILKTIPRLRTAALTLTCLFLPVMPSWSIDLDNGNAPVQVVITTAVPIIFFRHLSFRR